MGKLAILAVLAVMVSTVFWRFALVWRQKQENRSMRAYLHRISPTE